MLGIRGLLCGDPSGEGRGDGSLGLGRCDLAHAHAGEVRALVGEAQSEAIAGREAGFEGLLGEDQGLEEISLRLGEIVGGEVDPSRFGFVGHERVSG